MQNEILAKGTIEFRDNTPENIIHEFGTKFQEDDSQVWVEIQPEFKRIRVEMSGNNELSYEILEKLCKEFKKYLHPVSLGEYMDTNNGFYFDTEEE